jgi:DNA-binding response OmpR family regulator
MARVLICEPHAEVRSLLAHVVARLGHEPVFPPEDGAAGIPDASVDVLVIEPADPRALASAQIVRLEREAIPIVCASIHPPSTHTRRLEPLAYLVKPFALGELEAALASAVARIEVAA